MTSSTKTDISWQTRGTCRVEGHPTHLFFPHRGGDNGNPAKQICGRCPVQTECLAYAQAAVIGGDRGTRHGPKNGSPVQGIWGGVAFDERVSVRARRKTTTMNNAGDLS